MKAVQAALLAVVAAAFPASRAEESAAPLPSEVDARKAASRGIDFLLSCQSKDGSWGTTREAMQPVSWTSWWSDPEYHRSIRVGTTGLCVSALLRTGDPRSADAVSRAVDYLVANADLRRPSAWDADNVWGLIFGLEALCRAERHEAFRDRDARRRIRAAAETLLRKLLAHQTPSGGWGYYTFDSAARPALTMTFATANAVLALREARESGHAVPAAAVDAAVRALRRSRLPSGAYTYRVDAVPSPGRATDINQLKGSLARMQACNVALLAERRGVEAKDLDAGIETFFLHHRFLEVACYRPTPHEAYYANAAYFYLYGHAYAGEAIRLLPPAARARHRPRLLREILRAQCPDGSWWDDPTWKGYNQPHGTALALIALLP